MDRLIKILKQLKNNIKKMMSFIKHQFIFRTIRYLKKPNLPQNPDGKVLVHIGCGELNDKRYINLDTRPMPHIHYVGTVLDVDKFFKEYSVDLIYLCHILEHVSHLKLKMVLKKLYGCLKSGGILRLSVPDFDKLIYIYNETFKMESILTPLMGGQDYEGNFHHTVFNKVFLRSLLSETGFKEVRAWDSKTASYHNFDDWSKIKYPYDGKEWDISLNLEAVK